MNDKMDESLAFECAEAILKLEHIADLTKLHPNDKDLGEHVRKLIMI